MFSLDIIPRCSDVVIPRDHAFHGVPYEIYVNGLGHVKPTMVKKHRTFINKRKRVFSTGGINIIYCTYRSDVVNTKIYIDHPIQDCSNNSKIIGIEKNEFTIILIIEIFVLLNLFNLR